MTSFEILSVIALCVSAASLSLGIYLLARDRDRLRARSKFHPACKGYPAWMEVEAVNEGRRPIVLTTLVRDFADGSSASTQLANDRGVRLDENELFSEDICTGSELLYNMEGCAAIDLWFMDTRGRRYRIEDAKLHLERLLNKQNFLNIDPENGNEHGLC